MNIISLHCIVKMDGENSQMKITNTTERKLNERSRQNQYKVRFMRKKW